MTFQVNSTDLKPDTEIKEFVATAEEEFKNSTEKTERKLVPEDEDDEDSGGSGHVLPQRKPMFAGGSGLVLPQWKQRFFYFAKSRRVKPQWKEVYPCEIITINPHLEDKDEDEEMEMSRTQSMDNLALMQKPL